jgi:hypothetical protein
MILIKSMRYYLLFIVLNLAIILAYADFDDKGKLRIEKMKNHMRKVKGLLRNLDSSESDDESDDESNDDEEGSGSEDENPSGNTTQPTVEETLPTTPKNTGRKNALIQLIGFNSFKAEPREEIITFRTYFIYINIYPARYVLINIAIKSTKGFRNLDDGDVIKKEPANCSISKEDENKTEGNVRYDCNAKKDSGAVVTNVTVLNVTFSEPKLNMEDINYSEEAALAAAQLSSQTQEINKMFTLNGGRLTTYPNYFIITGEITDEDFKPNYGITDSLILKVVDNSTDPSTAYNVSCKAQDNENNNYEFRCTPEEGVKGSIYLSTITDGKKNAVSLNLTRGNDSVDYSKSSTTPTTNINKGIATYRKSSSGLSGGAIAGIVIACAVVLIVASLIAIMMKKSTVAAAPFQTQTPSIVGLRSVDNSTQ